MKVEKFKKDCTTVVQNVTQNGIIYINLQEYVDGFLFGSNDHDNLNREIDILKDWEEIIKVYTYINEKICLDKNFKRRYKDLTTDQRNMIGIAIKRSITSNLAQTSQVLVKPKTKEDLQKKLFLECITEFTLNENQSKDLKEFIDNYLFQRALNAINDPEQKNHFDPTLALDNAKKCIKPGKHRYRNLPYDVQQGILKKIEECLEQYFTYSSIKGKERAVDVNRPTPSSTLVSFGSKKVAFKDAVLTDQTKMDLIKITTNGLNSFEANQVIKLVLNDQTIDAPTKAVRIHLSAVRDAEPNPIKTAKRTSKGAVVEFKNEDSFVAAKELKDHDKCKRPLVMNLANRFSIGGGWVSNAKAQEEALFRRSNLFQSLYAAEDPPKINTGEEGRYGSCSYRKPIEHDAANYSKDVTVLYDQEYNQLLEEDRFKVDVLTIAGYDLGKKYGVEGDLPNLFKRENRRPNYSKPNSDEDALLYKAYSTDNKLGDPSYNTLKTKFTELTRDKIILSLKIAMAQGNDSLVLGAISCGAFRFEAGENNEGPVDRGNWTVGCVTKAYKDAFEAVGYKNINKHFTHITFAVKSGARAPNRQEFRSYGKYAKALTKYERGEKNRVEFMKLSEELNAKLLKAREDIDQDSSSYESDSSNDSPREKRSSSWWPCNVL